MFRQVVGDLSLTSSDLFARLLDHCLKLKSPHNVRRVHARIIKTQFTSEVFIQNRLIDVYGKCGYLCDAHKLFNKMFQRNTYSWNSLLGVLLNAGSLDEAEGIFQSMPDPDQCSWNSMVSGFAQHDRFDASLNYFVRMHEEGFRFNEYTYGSVLSACSGLRDSRMGSQVHASILKSLCSSHVYIGSALIDMYSKSGIVRCARSVFDEMYDRNVVSWNSLITCYEQNGPASKALEVFMEMMDFGFEPDEVTLASVVSACASLSAIKEGKQIHARILEHDKFRDDLIISNALVDMYAKCCQINEARWIFDKMPTRNIVSETSMVSGYVKAASVKTAKEMFLNMMERNVVSWNALIAGYTQCGENEEALALFRLLKKESVWPTDYTFGNLLNACANLADLRLGRQAHVHVLKHGFLFQPSVEHHVFVGNSLIDMYMKCGSVEDGSKVFENMIKRDLVSWNAMIVGFAQNGHGSKALALFRKMLAVGEKPDQVTMIGVLSACSHAGLVEEGRQYFFSMHREYNLEPLKDHYTCMVDLLGRAGCLEEARNLIVSMPMQPDGVVWSSLLAACKIHNDIVLGKFVAEKLLEIDPKNSSPYVLLSNMYAKLGRWREVVKVRKLMRQRGVIKQPGCSWIEICGQVHVFMVKDKRHPQKREIYLLLKRLAKLMRLAGYVPDASSDLEADEEQNESDIISLSGNIKTPAIAVMA